MVAKRRASQVDEHNAAKSAHPSHLPFQKSAPWAGPTEYGSRTSKEILAKLRDFGNRKPNKAWAQKIIDRHAAGEHIQPHALFLAREVAREWPEAAASREPGSDDV